MLRNAHPNLTRPDAPWADLLEGRTYLKIAYLLLGFPLGLMYFVVIVTGLALGLGLSITLLGIPVLLGVIGFVWSFVWFEREVAAVILGIKPDLEPTRTPSGTRGVSEIPSGTMNSVFTQWWNSLRSYLSSGLFWRGLAHLLLRFPLGIFGFVVTVVLLSLSAALIGMPFYYGADWDYGWMWWQPNFTGALCLSVVGLGVGLVSLRVLNLLALGMAHMTYSLLEDSRPLEPTARNGLEPTARNDLEPAARNDLEPASNSQSTTEARDLERGR